MMNDTEKKEFERLQKIYGKNDEIVTKLCQEVAFMKVTLETLKNTIKSEGAVITSTNGNGFQTIQEHPAQKSYNVMIRNYTSVLKRLKDITKESSEDLDELEQWVK